MNLEIKKIKNKIDFLLKDREILDVVLFGSAIKGKTNPNDLDLAIIAREKKNIELEGFHITNLTSEDFISKPITLINTLFREGYSLKYDKSFSEKIGFNSKILYTYKLKNLPSSKKVIISRIFHGNKKEKGLIEKFKGYWLSNQVFAMPIESDDTIEKFMIYHSIDYTKSYLLMH